MYKADIFTAPASLAGLPAISVPCGLDKDDLPVGMQLIGSQYNDGQLLAAAHAYLENYPFKEVNSI